jgi:3-phosphoshikimate 1-carboxyvinyltransferase
LDASIQPPGSKSLTNRALVCAALAEGPSQLNGALSSEDTLVMIDALKQLGVSVDWSADNTCLHIGGLPEKPWATSIELDIANSGTTIRFLAALLSTIDGEYRLDGTARMKERPMGDLIDAINQLGGDIRSLGDNDCPPLLVKGSGLVGGLATLRGDISSQFLSGLLLAAPQASQNITLQLETPLVSEPYVRMTISVMAAFGVDVSSPTATTYHVASGQTYGGCHYAIEPDASAASYFWAAAAIAGGKVTVLGLTPTALQGDVDFCNCLQTMGCQVTATADGLTVQGAPLRGIEVDMNAISDTVPTLAVVALFASSPTRITNVAHIRHKECDRIGDLACELRKLGATVLEHDDGLTIEPAPLHGAELDTYHDHRMAMSLALAGLKLGGVVIKDPECTAKTYPGYFEDLDRVIHGR